MNASIPTMCCARVDRPGQTRSHLWTLGRSVRSAVLAGLTVLAGNSLVQAADEWHSFQNGGNPSSEMKHAPVKWSPKDNVAWSTSLPGYGQSAPVAWTGKLYVTSVDGPEKETLIICCFDAKSGKRHDPTNAEARKFVVSDYRCPSDPGPETIAIYDCGSPPSNSNTPTVMVDGVASTSYVGSLGGARIGGSDPLYGCYERQPFNGMFHRNVSVRTGHHGRNGFHCGHRRTAQRIRAQCVGRHRART